MENNFKFEVEKKLGLARLTKLSTPHGVVKGPFFQFVATQAAIRGMVYAEDLENIGIQIVLSNTYHLHLKPGDKIVATAGGLHGFMQWSGPMTTDSGGYQVFSLGKHVKLDKDGVSFRSPDNGDLHRLTPETTIQIQANLGADIIMPLDVCTPYGASRDDIEKAVDQTTEWAKRCLVEHKKISSSQVLYGIVQGGLHQDLREKSATSLRKLDFFGYSIGGEMRDKNKTEMEQGVKMTVGYLPEEKPRYLMGAGTPEDIVRAVRVGVDQFDCVLPIRNARHGKLYLEINKDELKKCLIDPSRPVVPDKLYRALDIRKSKQRTNFSEYLPKNPAIPKKYSFAYINHLMKSEPPSGYRLAVLNNINFYKQLMEDIREIIKG